MALITSHFGLNNLSGGIYNFEKIGDVVPMHTHEAGRSHITVVVCGKIKAYGDGWENEHSAGDVIDFPINQAHEIMALEDDTRIVNIIKNEL